MSTPSVRWVDSGPTSPIQWIYREWVWEQGLSKGYNNKTWLWMDWITRTWTKVWNSVICLIRGASCSYYFFSASLQRFPRSYKLLSSSPFSWRTSYIIYLLSVDPGPPFVDHAGHLSSACSISRLSKPSMSCSNQSSTVQGSFSH